MQVLYSSNFNNEILSSFYKKIVFHQIVNQIVFHLFFTDLNLLKFTIKILMCL